MIVNPFLISSVLPLFKQIDVKLHGYSAVRLLIDKQKEEINEFMATINAKLNSNKQVEFEDIFDKLDKIQYPLSNTFSIISHLSGVADSKDIREIKDKFRSELIELGKQISQSKTIYDGVKLIKTDNPHEKRVIDLTIEGMEKGGVNLEEDIKNRVKEIDILLSNKSSKFSENLLDEVKSYKLIISKDTYKGDISIMKKTPLWAREIWNSEDPENGPWNITLGGPSVMAAFRHLHDSELRKELFMKYISSAGDKNEELIKSIMKLRLEKSKILGFNNFAELSLSSKMADNVDEILSLLDDLKKVALPKAIDEFNEIKEYAFKNGGSIEPWDMSFWAERLKENKFSMSEEELKPYFSLENVLKELFNIANNLFGVEIKERNECVEVWHDDVKYYDVYEDGKIIAGFYLDPYVREGTKRSGAWMDSCVDKNKVLGHDIPVAYLICNGSPPSKDKPSLMSFSDVETLFHEFGHGLQHMLTRIDIGDISGINSIEWDAVELPSQFMENWCYNKGTLDRMAIHYLDGSKLPNEMYNSLISQKNFGVAMGMMRQISFSKIDLYLHNNWDDIEKSGKSIWDIQNEFFKECCPYKKILKEDKFLASFSHIFGGYAAGYYSYKWAEIMSADCFEAFEEDPSKYKEKGLLFRNTVLALGGSQPAMDTFIAFRGRKPTVDALLKHNELKN